jgi:enediyne biosynthesis protein E4
VIVVENGGPSRVFVNRLDRPNRSVRVQLVGSGKSNRDAIGARAIATVGNQKVAQSVSGGQSYLSSPEKTLTFGLGDAAKIDFLDIRWPDGSVETRRDIPGGARVVVREGAGAESAR